MEQEAKAFQEEEIEENEPWAMYDNKTEETR